MILVMEGRQMVLAFLLTALVGLGVVQIWQMALILALTRICVTFELPSRQVFFFDLVGHETCRTRSPSTRGCSTPPRVIGPALAGLCLALLRRDRLLHAQRRELPGGDRRAAVDPAPDAARAHRRAPGLGVSPGRLGLHPPATGRLFAVPAHGVLRCRRHGLRGDDPRLRPPWSCTPAMRATA